MKLLFDHNLSPRLVSRLADIYPHSSGVSSHTLYPMARQGLKSLANSLSHLKMTK